MICESTGCYHEELVDAMHDAGIAIIVANPRQVRDFAKGKPKKLALIAVARKLLLILNQMARPAGESWKTNGTGTSEPINEKSAHEKSSRVPSLNEDTAATCSLPH